MKLKTETPSTEKVEQKEKETKTSLADHYRDIIKTRLNFIEESLVVIREAFSHLSEDEDND